MATIGRWTVGAAVLVCATAVGCGDDVDGSPRSAEQLAERLVEPADLPGTWTVHGRFAEAEVDGVVTDEAREMLPGVGLCDAASDASKAAAASLAWKAFRQLDLEADDPLDPPVDRSGRMVFAQEFVTSGAVGDLAVAFDAVRDGVLACLGEIPAGEEGSGMVTEMEVPEVGDERVATLTELEEAGGWAQWRLHEVLVRDGSTLVRFTFVEIRSLDVEPQYTVDEVGEIVATVVDRL